MAPIKHVVGPAPATHIPRFAGEGTFLRLPRIDQVPDYDVAIVGVPFDGGTTLRPGARFGPEAIRSASRLVIPGYDVTHGLTPVQSMQVVDAGDIGCTPFDNAEAVQQIASQAEALVGKDKTVLALGGDHTIAVGMIRATTKVHGPVALLHFDAHLDTWDTYFGEAFNHGSPFRRVFEEGLLRQDQSMHVGIRAAVYGEEDLTRDQALGFRTIRTSDIEKLGIATIVRTIEERLQDVPVYLSIDIDVLDPAFAPGTGTPVTGGMSTREMQQILRRLTRLNLVGADIVEVAPAYDHAQVTALAAASLAHDILGLIAARTTQKATTNRGQP